MAEAVVIALSYLLGSVPFGYWITKIKGVDIRRQGSGNIGFANVLRTAGPKYAIPTLLFDGGKGYLPVSAAFYLGLSEQTAILAGLAAICGHNWSIFLKGAGGKGVLTSCGVFLALSLIPTLCALGVFCAVLLLTRYISLSSTSAAISLPCFILLISGIKTYVFALSVIAATFVAIKHIPNFRRIKEGTEPKV
jgi:glycerol-3-phosphate acyltransferase PlsY